MKKSILAITAFSLFIGLTGAIAGYNGSTEGPHILKSGPGASGASATTAVGPNGTSYHVELAETNVSGTITNESVTLVNRSNNSLEFEGKIRSPTPCHTVKHDVEESNNSLSIDVTMEASDRMCVQQVVMKSYEGSAEMEGLEEVTVKHRGEEMAVFETVDPQPIDPDTGNRSAVDAFVSWFSGFF